VKSESRTLALSISQVVERLTNVDMEATKMIRAVGTQKDGRKLLILGVDAINLENLKAKNAILVRGTQFGINLPVDVLIMYGDTLEEVAEDLRKSGVGSIPTPLPDPVEGGSNV